MGGLSQSTQLLGQIKNFVLTEEVDVKSLHTTLRKQVSLITSMYMKFWGWNKEER